LLEPHGLVFAHAEVAREPRNLVPGLPQLGVLLGNGLLHLVESLSAFLSAAIDHILQIGLHHRIDQRGRLGRVATGEAHFHDFRFLGEADFDLVGQPFRGRRPSFANRLQLSCGRISQRRSQHHVTLDQLDLGVLEHLEGFRSTRLLLRFGGLERDHLRLIGHFQHSPGRIVGAPAEPHPRSSATTQQQSRRQDADPMPPHGVVKLGHVLRGLHRRGDHIRRNHPTPVRACLHAGLPGGFHHRMLFCTRTTRILTHGRSASSTREKEKEGRKGRPQPAARSSLTHFVSIRPICMPSTTRHSRPRSLTGRQPFPEPSGEACRPPGAARTPGEPPPRVANASGCSSSTRGNNLCSSDNSAASRATAIGDISTPAIS